MADVRLELTSEWDYFDNDFFVRKIADKTYESLAFYYTKDKNEPESYYNVIISHIDISNLSVTEIQALLSVYGWTYDKKSNLVKKDLFFNTPEYSEILIAGAFIKHGYGNTISAKACNNHIEIIERLKKNLNVSYNQ